MASAYQDLLDEVSAGAMLAEEQGLVLPGELELQALWFAGQMGREFFTVDDRAVRVVQFGHWNHGAGPDFLHAAVEVDGELFVGAIELDHGVNDWEGHGHAWNDDFNEVVLHVVFSGSGKLERFTRTADHREVPRVEVPAEVVREALNYPAAKVAAAHRGRCYFPLAGMADGDVKSLLMEAARHRARAKVRRRAKSLDVSGEREWLWQVFAATLGYFPNKLAMVLLAQRLPVRDMLRKGEEVEAILFGAAGFLSAGIYQQSEGDNRVYLRSLWESWWRLRSEYEPAEERRIRWCYTGVRPMNHPQRRLACLAGMVNHWQRFSSQCRRVLAGESIADFEHEMGDVIERLSHPYWDVHYTLKSKPSAKPLSLLGDDRLRDFLVNQLLPVRLVSDDVEAWECYEKTPAPALSKRVKTASLRLFGVSGKGQKWLRKTWQHQALLQIYQDFCLRDVSDCERCPFPAQLKQWKG